MDYNNNRLPGHSGPGGLLLSCGKKKQKIKNVFRTAKKPCTHRALKADDGNRTRLPSLGSWCSTDELHLRNKDIIPYISSISSIFLNFPNFPKFFLFSNCPEQVRSQFILLQTRPDLSTSSVPRPNPVPVFYNTLFRKLLVRSSLGLPNTSSGVPCSTI